MPKLLVIGAIAVFALYMVGGARAASYATTCTVDPPLCERVEAVVTAIEALPQTDAEYDYAAVLAAIEANTAGSGEPAEVAGTVALSERDREASSLSWYGVWAIVGLLLVMMIAPTFSSLLDIRRGM